MKSFAILRTNVGLTTNVKITVDSEYNLSLDSIESHSQLSKSNYKKVKFSSKNFYDELIPFFFKETPAEIAYSIKQEDDISLTSKEFKDQFDKTYDYGARNISNNKDYTEEFEYFAPLYLQKDSIPSKFIIFRIDGPGLLSVNKNNFDFEILKKLKTVKVFDLLDSSLGQWLKLNFKDNEDYPDSGLEIDFRNLEFTRWIGIDFQTGGYIQKSFFLEDYFAQEKEIFQLEKFVVDSYKNNKVIFPNILNLNFLFDDEPSTESELRKWSINRYLGFYLDDLELQKVVSPYITPKLRSDVKILEGNILSSLEIDPFEEGFSQDRPFYVEYLGNHYLVQRFSEIGTETVTQVQQGEIINEVLQRSEIVKYKIISDLDLSGKESQLNKNFVYIRGGVLFDFDNLPLVIENFDQADVWIIEIDGIYHNLIEDSGQIRIISDYTFEFRLSEFIYKRAGVEKVVSTQVDYQNNPKYFNIYRCKFTDIKDFDTRIVDTEYSKFEYEKFNDITTTEESKMYVEDLNDNQNPRRLEDFIFRGETENIPASSEYTANHETFKLVNGELSEIWRKNPVYCRWAFQNSISSNDYPYLLNNSLIFEDYNRVCNPLTSKVSRIERNLDYFYTINSSTSSYQHHSLHVEKVDDNGDIDEQFEFDLLKYLNKATYSIGTSSATYSLDYFSLFFEQNQKFLGGKIKTNKTKYSLFNRGDSSTPNITLFRGLKFLVYDVESIKKSNNYNIIDNINLRTQNTFNGYKFSILMSDNNLSVDSFGQVIDSNNSMSWSIIESWQMEKIYSTGSIVVFDDILYEATSESLVTSPTILNSGVELKAAPYNSSSWTFSSPLPSLQSSQPIFWSPNYIYQNGDLVYNSGGYYSYDILGVVDFWNPNKVGIGSTGYGVGEVVLFRGTYYQSSTSSNLYPPDYKRSIIDTNGSSFTFWQATQSLSPKWNTVPIWSENQVYQQDKYVVKNDIVYKSLATSSTTQIPGISTNWSRIYSLEQDTDFVYGTSSQLDNPIIKMNDEFYLLNSNSSNSTLENGIVIYINKKWKNILININISDNTIFETKNIDRDELYKNTNSKLTALNFVDCINDISTKFGFSDYLSYVVIDENLNIKKYNLEKGISELPYYITCELPDEFTIKIDSLTKNSIPKPDKLKVKSALTDNIINNISELNGFNNSYIASTIVPNQTETKKFDFYHGNKNFESDVIYRFSGFYMPLFYEVQLFNKDFDREIIGNYKFDKTLTEFALVKEVKYKKVNHKGSILKLANETDSKSIYPMVDEFGLGFDDFFIFKSSWDFNYHVETYKERQQRIIVSDSDLDSLTIQGFGQSFSNTQNNQTF